MSDLLTYRLNAIKQQEEIKAKPFPLWALLVMYERGSLKDLYCNYFEGFKILIDWLKPIQIPAIENSLPIYKLHSSYAKQEIATILKCTQGQIENGYQDCISKLLIATHPTFMSEEVSTIPIE